MHKVALTGLGMVTSLGTTADETITAWGQGLSMRTGHLPGLAGTPMAEAPVAVLPEFNPAKRLGGRKMLKFMSASAPLGCVAAREALNSANVRPRYSSERIGLFAAAGLPAADLAQINGMIENSLDQDGAFSSRLFGENGLPVTNPLLAFQLLANMPACLVSIIEGIKGPNCIYTPWESHAGLALREAWLAVGEGEADCVLVGGDDAPAHPYSYFYLRQGGWLREDEIPSNAGAYLVLERLETARDAGIEILATIDDVAVSWNRADVHDPLAKRMGRTLAAAPFILTGLACRHANLPIDITGADGWTVSVRLGRET